MNYAEQYKQYHDMIEEALPAFVPQDIPSPLRDAMLYSLMAGGKRLRAVLLLASYHLLGKDLEQALELAATLEMVHAYSLIHDDLPAMDNDDLRRGKPTCHKVYGEGMAVLAGDGLLSLAFENLSASKSDKAVQLLRELATRCGTRGMVGGQCADLQGETNGGDEKLLYYIHRHKTADLITAPVVMGLIAAGADDEMVEAGREYGQALGMAFQIVDDILDVVGSQEMLGKHIGKDAQENKCTWVSIYGMEKANADAKSYTAAAVAAIDRFGEKASFLKETALNMLQRVQ